MVLGWLSGAKGAVSVNDLIARKKYAQAIELLRAEFQRGSRDPRLRLQLADVLALAGKAKEAVPVLLGLADEFALEGFAAKAISVLKKVQKLDPSRSREIEGRLAKLIKEKQRDLPAPTAAHAGVPAFGVEEIDIAPNVSHAAADAPPALADEGPMPGLVELETAAASFGADAEPEMAVEELGDELLSVIEGVLKPAPASAPRPAGGPVPDSPLFSDFSQDELLAVIQGLRLLSFEPGDILITEGETGDSVFVLTAGAVKAFVKDPAGKSVQVREMAEGSFFGEISILSGRPRTATVTAKTACELLELDRPTLDAICATHPRVREVLQRFYDERVRNEQEQRIRQGEAR